MKKRLLLAAIIILTLITIPLLVYSVEFFHSAPVRMQLQAWMQQIAPGAISANTGQTTMPAEYAASTRKKVSQLEPTLTPSPIPTQRRAPTRVQPGKIEATPKPVVQVVEDSPPDGSLVIPVLGIDQPLVPVIVRDQTWDLDNLGTQIGWLQTTGSHPRDDLAMVLVGHIILPYPGGAGPFLNLYSLRKGDVVGYRTGQVTYIYEVKGQALVNPEAVDRLYHPDGKRLLLVTCDGYNALERKYDLRLIVEAELISVEK